MAGSSPIRRVSRPPSDIIGRSTVKEPINIMVWNAARGGMRTVVESYRSDGFLARHRVELIAAYVDGNFMHRQMMLLAALTRFCWVLLVKDVGLVHIHAAMRGSFWRKGMFSTVARLFGKPVLLHLHGSEFKPFYERQPEPLRAAIRRHLERATRVLVLSESWRDYITSIAPGAAITVVPNYVTLPPAIAPETRDGDQILFLGLVGERKGVFDLIPAFAPVHRQFAGARLTIAGNGEVERARRLCADHGLADCVALPGWTDGAAKQALLDRAAIYTLPSHNEGLPMSVLEAMAAGLAVVTTRVGGVPELITDGVDGLLVNAGDQEAIGTALGRLLGDADLRHQIALAGRERISARYSDRAVLPLLSSIYSDTLRAH